MRAEARHYSGFRTLKPSFPCVLGTPGCCRSRRRRGAGRPPRSARSRRRPAARPTTSRWCAPLVSEQESLNTLRLVVLMCVMQLHASPALCPVSQGWQQLLSEYLLPEMLLPLSRIWSKPSVIRGVFCNWLSQGQLLVSKSRSGLSVAHVWFLPAMASCTPCANVVKASSGVRCTRCARTTGGRLPSSWGGSAHTRRPTT